MHDLEFALLTVFATLCAGGMLVSAGLTVWAAVRLVVLVVRWAVRKRPDAVKWSSHRPPRVERPATHS
jgi:hypothetical protein